MEHEQERTTLVKVILPRIACARTALSCFEGNVLV